MCHISTGRCACNEIRSGCIPSTQVRSGLKDDIKSKQSPSMEILSCGGASEEWDETVELEVVPVRLLRIQ